MNRNRVNLLAALLFTASFVPSAFAGHGHHRGGGCAAGCVECAPQLVTKTVMVPQTTYQTITVQGMACKPEVRQITVNACRLVPETTMVNCLKTICVPQQKTWTENYTVCHMTFDTAQKQVTVMVPHRELRQGVRTVCQPIPTQVMHTVCKDLGQWTTKSYVDQCGCKQTCQVWAPNIVSEQVPVTVYKPNFVEVPYQYEQIVCRPEVRNVTVQVPRPVYENKTRQVSCLVPTFQQVQAQVPRTTFKTVVEPKVVNYTAMVPVPVTKQVTVPVCTLVPKTITCAVCPGCH